MNSAALYRTQHFEVLESIKTYQSTFLNYAKMFYRPVLVLKIAKCSARCLNKTIRERKRPKRMMEEAHYFNAQNCKNVRQGGCGDPEYIFVIPSKTKLSDISCELILLVSVVLVEIALNQYFCQSSKGSRIYQENRASVSFSSSSQALSPQN